MGFLLFIIASILQWAFAPALYGYGFFASFIKGGSKEWNKYNEDLAIAKDQYGNAIGKYFFNWLLIKKDGYRFGNVDETISVDKVTVSKIQLKKSEQEFSHIINKYTKLDPTLPRVNNILCPNANCKTNTEDAPKEIIYIRYDDTQMSYVYLCSTCDTVWKNK